MITHPYISIAAARRCVSRLILLLCILIPCPPCGEGSACSLQDNSKIGPGLLLLMSGGRSWNPVGP